MIPRYFRFLPLLLSIAAVLIFGGFVPRAQAAQAAPTAGAVAEKEQGVSLKPASLFTIGKFTVTNSMIVTWIVAFGIIIFAQVATRNIKPVPSGAQNFWEWMVEGLYNFLESVIGPHLVRKTFWFFATIFIFILFLNWFGLIPGVGTIGWGHHNPITGLFHVDRPLLRGANADLNLTFAMAAVFFALWLVWAVQEVGFGGFVMHIFGPKGHSRGFLKILMIIVFFMVGWLEVV
jgi:F-type H+-transporting ATPase subunit a